MLDDPADTAAPVAAISSAEGNGSSPPTIRTAVASESSKKPSLNVSDALSYLDAVKTQFHEQPDTYNQFLDIMKSFKSQAIDTPGVIKRVSALFNEHPILIQGFNTFLPSGYRIECGKDSQDSTYITVTTPTGTTTAKNGLLGIEWPTQEGPTVVPPPPPTPPPKATPVEETREGRTIDPAIQYVQKIKQRCDPETYKQFLDILSNFHHSREPTDETEVSRKIARLFKDEPDLREDFETFLPDRGRQLIEEGMALPRPERAGLRKQEPPPTNPAIVPQKRKRKNPERDVDAKPVSSKVKKSKPTPEPPSFKGQSPPPPRRQSGIRAHDQTPTLAAAPEDSQAQAFFDRVKRTLEDSRDTYNEFLKLINLFTQNFIDTARLVRESRTFIGDGELLSMLKDILGWDDRKEQEYLNEERANGQTWIRPTLVPNNVVSRAKRPAAENRIGSYRKIPAAVCVKNSLIYVEPIPIQEANVVCSGRDEMCQSVLNDEWVSHPTWSSEDAGFITPRMNIYEEALHRSEEERHEYDFHIEAIVRTISMLEPLHNKLATLTHDEDRQNYKLKPNLNGQMKSIHHRVIKKIYGREAGLAVIQSLQDNPVNAIPVVLQRLKGKEEEWKRAQREWNKIWREVDARNYSKSLDHQGITFKMADKKAITTKAFLTQIESAREQQIGKRAALIDPLFARTRPRHQLEFLLDDVHILQDALKLIFSYLDRMPANFSERRRVETFLRSFVPSFFMIDPVAFNAAFVVVTETADSEISDEGVYDSEMSSVVSASSGAAKSRKQPDLRKKLLKSEQAKSTRKTRYNASPSVSRPVSPLPMDEDTPDQTTFFTNTGFYSLLRLLEILCSRLSIFKKLSSTGGPKQLPTDPGAFPHPDTINLGEPIAQPEHFYDILLQSCEQLFENNVEPHIFEDQMRYMFGVKHAYKIFTIDKLLAALVKQVQTLLTDPRTQELLELLKRDRLSASPDLSSSRKAAEEILGPEENFFRIDWLPQSKHITFQLIGKDDPNLEDSEVVTGRWQSYIESFVSPHLSEGVLASRVRQPFLRRNLPAAARRPPPNAMTADGLEIKVCVQTYKLFYVAQTEDYLFKPRSREEVEAMSAQVKRKDESREKWLKEGTVFV
ncbi:HDAC-interact domain-containing protein [Mycena indigotica]|uniref:HDAC-interact domain-containing protein n=1 Tax=Mycena indigotica TaxID=2126181 RepID=A0A8H6T6X1_9AGAR|nr:HDAC-interact domain-containing protein [Mycena indigotica]KAF7312188.1 HDAC-interact domain-containing protein [Mycena indigotica]